DPRISASVAAPKLIGRYGALLPLFRLVGALCIAALWRVKSLPRHRGDRPKLMNGWSAPLIAGRRVGLQALLSVAPGGRRRRHRVSLHGARCRDGSASWGGLRPGSRYAFGFHPADAF